MVNLRVFKVRLKQRKVSSHPPSSISPSNISPSPIPPSPSPPSGLLSQFDYLNIKNHSVHLRYDCWQFVSWISKERDCVAFGWRLLDLAECINEIGPGPASNSRRVQGLPTLVMREEHGQRVPCDPRQVTRVEVPTPPSPLDMKRIIS